MDDFAYILFHMHLGTGKIVFMIVIEGVLVDNFVQIFLHINKSISDVIIIHNNTYNDTVWCTGGWFCLYILRYALNKGMRVVMIVLSVMVDTLAHIFQHMNKSISIVIL